MLNFYEVKNAYIVIVYHREIEHHRFCTMHHIIQHYLLPFGAAVFLLNGSAAAMSPAVTDVTPPNPATAAAEEPNFQTDFGGIEDVVELSLTDLLNLNIAVASASARTVRNSPGIVSVLSRDELLHSGARDLIDALRLIPGLSFNVDVQGSVGISVRGMWAQEGKVLVLLDGVRLNEAHYSTFTFGHHIAVDQIERIEVIRGPGSVLYGGFAELAVINIVTRSGAALSGGEAYLRGGSFENEFGYVGVGVEYGQQITSYDLEYSFALASGYANMDDGLYRDYFGGSFAAGEDLYRRPLLLNLGLRYGDISSRLVYDDFTMGDRDGYDAVITEGVIPTRFLTLGWNTQVVLSLGDRATLTPSFKLNHQKPWQGDNDIASSQNNADLFHYVVVSNRATLGLRSTLKLHDALNLLLGSEYYVDKAHDPGKAGRFPAGDDLTMHDMAAFAQLESQWRWLTFDAGGRYEWHSEAGAEFVPRGALTAVYDNFHAKLLASQAFRTPSILNVALNPTVRAEKTSVFEVEVGYRLTPDLLLTANAFELWIDDPIVYFYDEETDEEGYSNENRTGTRGVETELRLKRRRGYGVVNYSFARPRPDQGVATYAVAGLDNYLLGQSKHKVAAHGSVTLWRDLSFNPSAVFFSRQAAFADDVSQAFRDEIVLLNFNLRYDDLYIDGLALDGGIYNLLNADSRFVQPYNGLHAPLNDRSRQYQLRVAYRF